MNIEELAKICHSANKAYCEALGDFSQTPWELTSEEIKASVVDGVEAFLKDPKITAKKMHENWVKFKKDTGWSHGERKDTKLKTHPDLVDFKDLPKTEQLKSQLIIDICALFAEVVEDDDSNK